MPLAYLPNVKDLRSYKDLEQTQLLDHLFEPSPEIHSTLLPVLRTAEYSNYIDLIDACHVGLLSLAASLTSSATGKNDDAISVDSEDNSKATTYHKHSLTHPLNPQDTLLSILGSHPRLGAKKVDSVQSQAEQANLQGQGEQLAILNQRYEAKFPGLRYVVFVNGRGRPEIMNDMEERTSRGDFAKEVDAALQAMCDIAKDRASKLPMRDVVHPTSEDKYAGIPS